MTTDEMQLLRDFRSDIPDPDEQTVRRAYAYATTQPRAARRLRLRRPATTRTRVLGIAAAAGAGAAALIGFFVLPSTSPHHPVAGGGPHSGVQCCLAVPVDQALSVASKSFGVPIILPNTPVLKPSNLEPTAEIQYLPAPEPGAQEPVSQLMVQFPSPLVSITYAPTDLTYWGSHYPDALDQYKAEIAQSSTRPANLPPPPSYQIVYLRDGTPALIDTGQSGIGIEFRLGKLSIRIGAAASSNGSPTTVDASTVQAFAQSIVDQAATKNP